MAEGNQSDAAAKDLTKGIEGLEIQGEKCFFVHDFDQGEHQSDLEKEFLEALVKTLREDKFDVTIEELRPRLGEPVCKILEEIQNLKHAKLVLAFPEKCLCKEKLVQTINKILKDQLHFVIVIMYNDTFQALPAELKEFDMRRVEVDRNWIMEVRDRELTMERIAIVARDLLPFIRDEPETVDLAFLNSGTGLAWSYYFGYLRFILLGDEKSFEDKIRESKWRKEHPEIPDKNIYTKMVIVCPHDCREPKEMSTDPKIPGSDRIKFYENKIPVGRAGINRNYDFDFREIKSADGKESYYGVVYYLNVIQTLIEEMEDPNKEFCDLSEEAMTKEGQYVFEKLKLFLKHTEPKIPEETYKLIDYNPEKMKDGKSLADVLFDHLQSGPTLAQTLVCAPEDRTDTKKKETSPPKAHPDKINVLCSIDDYNHKMPEDVRTFIASGKEKNLQHEDCEPGKYVFVHYLDLIEKSSRIFMVLTDEFVKSEEFERVFFTVLHQVFEKQDRRFLVLLDCLKDIKHEEHPRALELRVFSSFVSHNNPQWAHNVQSELAASERLPVSSDLQFINIGTGLALSWYYRYLKIRMPKMADLFPKCEDLMKKFKGGRMSYKAFVLHPHSCITRESLSDVDENIQLVKDIKMPVIKKATRHYTPTLYRITDKTNEQPEYYYAFLEFNTQADTMNRMCKANLLTKSVMLSEWERFFNKLKTLICHEKEPMKLRDRMTTIEYDDRDMEPGALSKLVLRHIKDEIKKENGQLPGYVENGATVEYKENESKNGK